MKHGLLFSILFFSLIINNNCSVAGVDRTPSIQVKPIPLTTGVHYVAFGDSTGAGIGARNGGYVVRLYKELQKQRPNSTLTNLCVSGATTADLIHDQLDRGLKEDPQLVTIGIGINDIGHSFSLEQFAGNLESILRRLRSETKAVIVVSNIPDVSSSPRVPQIMRLQSQRTIEQFNTRLAQIATVNGATVFDVYSITHEELPKHPEYFSSDGFHPSDSGYELWAQQMWPIVDRTLSSQAQASPPGR
jgi:acyl-CoA thioesterase-1